MFDLKGISVERNKDGGVNFYDRTSNDLIIGFDSIDWISIVIKMSKKPDSSEIHDKVKEIHNG